MRRWSASRPRLLPHPDLRGQASEFPRDCHNHKADERSVSQTSRGLDQRTRALLEAPLLPLLLRLAVPNIVLMLAQSATGLIETYFVGKLGTDALAGAAVVFPGVMLMQMISAVRWAAAFPPRSPGARQWAAGRCRRAGLHAARHQRALGLIFSVGVLASGQALYRAMGAEGPSLAAALTYTNVIYAGAVLLWTMNALASVLRGTGNMVVPARGDLRRRLAADPAVALPDLRHGAFPRFGVAGGAVALLMLLRPGNFAVGRFLTRASGDASAPGGFGCASGCSAPS